MARVKTQMINGTRAAMQHVKSNLLVVADEPEATLLLLMESLMTHFTLPWRCKCNGGLQRRAPSTLRGEAACHCGLRQTKAWLLRSAAQQAALPCHAGMRNNDATQKGMPRASRCLPPSQGACRCRAPPCRGCGALQRAAASLKEAHQPAGC